MLPETLGNTNIKRIVNFYSKIFRKKYGFSPRVSYPKIGALYKPILQDMSEYQIALLILIHFEWKGTTGDDDFVHKRLSQNCFPLEWLPRNINPYVAYITNSLNIDFNNEEAVKEIVNEQL